jgi:regulator of sirC expression with transglutaminase-like and TPR domain
MDVLSRFAALASRPEPELAEAALLIGAAGDPGTQPDPWLTEIDRAADGVRDLDGLLHRLFVDMGFRGDSEDYYDPQNSFLHRVIKRRLGIPISLSVLTIEVGRRAGVRLDGIGMPGHFLVGIPGGATYVDAFAGGEVLDEAGAEALFRASTWPGGEVAFGPHLLPVVGPRAILIRMLANLRGVYEYHRSGPDLEWVARMRLVLPDVSADDVLALASALEQQGRFLEAAQELELRASADSEMAEELVTAAHRIRARFN